MEIFIQLCINGVTLGLSYVLIALGLTIIFSIMGIVNFAHGEIYMLGAFAIFVSVTQLGVNFFLGLIIAVAAVGFFGIIVERILFRKFRGQELNGLVLSLALSILLQNLALVIWGGEDRSFPSPFSGQSLDIFSASLSVDRVFTVAVGILALIFIYFFINRTKTGQAMQAVAQDLEAAALQGIDINRIGSATFFIGCALAGLAGALLAPIYFVSPYIGLLPVLKAFVVIVLGGLGSIAGAFVGGMLLGGIDSLCLYFLGTLGDMAGFVILILVIIFKPAGLLGHE